MLFSKTSKCCSTLLISLATLKHTKLNRMLTKTQSKNTMLLLEMIRSSGEVGEVMVVDP